MAGILHLIFVHKVFSSAEEEESAESTFIFIRTNSHVELRSELGIHDTTNLTTVVERSNDADSV